MEALIIFQNMICGNYYQYIKANRFISLCITTFILHADSEVRDERTQTGDQRDCVVRQNGDRHRFMGSHNKDLGFRIGWHQARNLWRQVLFQYRLFAANAHCDYGISRCTCTTVRSEIYRYLKLLDKKHFKYAIFLPVILK